MENKKPMSEDEQLTDTGTCFAVCRLDLRSGVLGLSEKFQELYQTSGASALAVPGQSCNPDFIQPETADVFQSMLREIYDGKREGIAVIGLLGRDSSDYIPVCVRWQKLADDGGAETEAILAVDPLRPDGGISSSERNELIGLRAKVALQSKYFHRIEEYQEQLRRYRHDRKNDLFSLSALISSGDLEGAKKYMEGIGKELSLKSPIVNTGNLALDSLISEKVQQAVDAGVKVDHMVGLPAGVKVEMRDLCAAVGCCLDNAVEACAEAKEKYPERIIMFRLIEKRGVITFHMINTSVTPPPPAGALPETSKADRRNHGYGLKTVSIVVKKYNGYLELTPEEGRFTTKFTLFSEA